MIGRDGKFEYVNHGFAELFGYEPSEVCMAENGSVLPFPIQTIEKKSFLRGEEMLRVKPDRPDAATNFHGPMQGRQQKDHLFQTRKVGHGRRFDDLRGYY